MDMLLDSEEKMIDKLQANENARLKLERQVGVVNEILIEV
jgi:hypothetical protein